MEIFTPKHVLDPEVALTTNTYITNGAHILYVSSDQEKYIENAVTFISAGLTLDHGIVFVDDQATFDLILKQLLEKGFTKKQLNTIVFAELHDFYKTNDVLDPEIIAANFSSILGPLLKKGIPIRTWGKVAWLKEQPCLTDLIKDYELASDEFINTINSFTVCAYDGMDLPSGIHMELMKLHQYIMSDNEFVVSSFYKNDRLHPTIRIEANYEQIIAKLETIHKHYMHFIEEMPDAVFITAKSTIVYANKSALKLLQCEFEELIGKAVSEISPPSYQNQNLFHEAKRIPVERKLMTSNGKLVDVEILSYPFVFDDTIVDTTITLARDIKERKQHEKLLIQSEKLGISGQLAAAIAHEIRNPLTAIKGFLKLSQEGAIELDIYSIIDQEIDRIETIASELLVLGKPVSFELKKMNVPTILRNVCTLMQSQANMENVSISFKAIDHELYIMGSEEQIKQVLLNIIKNGIEAIKGGGSITVEASKDADYAVIKIIDNGAGISDKIKTRLGEPFYSTKEKGTGLGLMVCYNIVNQHGGHIDFFSEEGKGTTFQIRLPLIKNEAK